LCWYLLMYFCCFLLWLSVNSVWVTVIFLFVVWLYFLLDLFLLLLFWIDVIQKVSLWFFLFVIEYIWFQCVSYCHIFVCNLTIFFVGSLFVAVILNWCHTESEFVILFVCNWIYLVWCLLSCFCCFIKANCTSLCLCKWQPWYCETTAKIRS